MSNFNPGVIPPLQPYDKLSNFPFIADDFDALTNYEKLAKIVEKMNQVIININNLNSEMSSYESEMNTNYTTFTNDITNQFETYKTTVDTEVSDFESTVNTRVDSLVSDFNELKTYVDNYFDNLDITNEVSNKIDSLVADGTIASIIEQYEWTQIEWATTTTETDDLDSTITFEEYDTRYYSVRNIDDYDYIYLKFMIGISYNTDHLIMPLSLYKTLPAKYINCTAPIQYSSTIDDVIYNIHLILQSNIIVSYTEIDDTNHKAMVLLSPQTKNYDSLYRVNRVSYILTGTRNTTTSTNVEFYIPTSDEMSDIPSNYYQPRVQGYLGKLKASS